MADIIIISIYKTLKQTVTTQKNSTNEPSQTSNYLRITFTDLLLYLFTKKEMQTFYFFCTFVNRNQNQPTDLGRLRESL